MTIRHDQVLAVARRVIDRADREHPADHTLRLALREERGLTRPECGRISDAVFAFYRWQGWLKPTDPLPDRITAALEMMEVFQNEPGSFPEDELCERAVPAWVKEEIEVTPAWASALQAIPSLWLRAKKGQGASLMQSLGLAEAAGPGDLSDTLRYFGPEDLFRIPDFRAGSFELQDLSSQMVGLICAPKPGETWWDACAGEGGKALHLSDLMENKGLIWVSDRAEWRLRKLKQRAARAKMFNYRMAAWDGGLKLPTKTKFDGVLVDGPCSGVGTWHRNPHARWTTGLEDVRELAQVQLNLLNHAASAVKPGGKLVYSVCTLTRSETISVVEQFVAAHPEMETLELADPLRPVGATAPSITYRTEECGGNGMFVAGWRRTA
jgi:16S rRNA (cytosine967-C5)-methyltransferase